MSTEALLSELLQAGGDDHQDADMQDLLGAVQRLQNQMENVDGAIYPTPGYVIKTTDEAGHKFFINLCTSPVVASPQGWTPGSIPDLVRHFLDPNRPPSAGFTPQVDQLLRIPMYHSKPRRDIDHKGENCTVIDCVVSLEVLKRAEVWRPFKMFLSQLAMHVTELECKTQLDPKHKLPKMRSKGKPAAMDLPPPPSNQPKTTATNSNATDSSLVNSTSILADGALRSSAPLQNPKKHQSVVVVEEHIPEEPVALEHSLRYLGKPAEKIHLTVTLPPSIARTAATASHTIRVDLVGAGEEVQVAIPGCVPLVVRLPFAVKVENGAGAGADLKEDGRNLEVQLVYKPLIEVWKSSSMIS